MDNELKDSSKNKFNTDSSTYQQYLNFVRHRLETTDFHAEAKLKAIDEISKMISLARASYLKSQES